MTKYSAHSSNTSEYQHTAVKYSPLRHGKRVVKIGFILTVFLRTPTQGIPGDRLLPEYQRDCTYSPNRCLHINVWKLG